MKHLFVTCQTPGSYFAFSEQIKGHLHEGQLRALVIVPVNRAVRRLKRLLTDRAENQALMDPPVFTFDQLLIHVYNHLPHSKRLIPPDTLLVLVQEILEGEPQRFQYLTRGQEVKGGLVHRVWEAITELRSFGFSSTELAGKEKEIADHHPEKFADFVNLLSAIEEKLGIDFIDEPFARGLAARTLQKEQFKALFPEVQALYISGYGLFSPPMLDFIDRVSQWLPVHVQLNYLPENQELFMHTRQALEKFKLLGARIDYKPSPSFLARSLFNRQKTVAKQNLSQRVHLVGLTNRQQEVAYIAGKIRQLNSQGIPLHKMAVTFSHLEKYAQTIRTVFEDFAIPFNLSTGFELLQSPLIADFLNVLKIIEENFPLESTLGFLQSRFVHIGESINFSLLKALLYKARLVSLTKQNLQNLKRFIPLLNEEDEKSLGTPDQLLEQVERLEAVLQPLFDFPRQATASQFRQQYLELCEHLGLLNWYRQRNEPLSERQKEHNFRAYNRFVKIFERSIWTLSLLHREQAISRSRLLDSLQRALLTATYNLTEWPDYGVQIMPRLEVLALDFEVLFIGGLIDGDFPRASVKDIFFNDRLRTELGLVASEELLDQDRFLFYQLLESKAQQLYLTFPQFQQEEALVPSSFLSDLGDVAIVDRQEPPEDDPLFANRQKLLSQFGLNIQLISQDEKLRQAMEEARLLAALTSEGNQSLRRLLDQIRFSLKRTMGKTFSAFEGDLSSFTEIQDRLRQRFADRVWSVSRLETYAQCPMKFFLSYILKLEPPQKIEDELTPQERGLILHRILYRFFSELKRIDRQHESWYFEDRLREIALQELEQWPYQGLLWEVEKMQLLGNERMQGVLPAFLKEEEKRMEGMPFVPQYFELSFGYSGDFPADSASVQQPVTLRNKNATLRLQGRIDRVDLTAERLAAIIDYKTGEVKSALVNETLEGRMLQIPLYMVALPQIVPDCTPVFGALYSLKSSEKVKLTPVIADAECGVLPKSRSMAYLPNKKFLDEDGNPVTFEAVLSRSVQFAVQYVQDIQNGKFNHTLNPGDRSCRTYCEFRRICQKVVGKLNRIAAESKAESDAGEDS